jgi:signal transduction histidine kinase
MNKISDEELLEELKRRFSENKNYIRELNKLTSELQTVNEKLKESEALKSHFISNISNEITNPFTSIICLSKNILEVKKEDWKTVISMVALIHSDAVNLDFQFKNIFAAAKLEAGEIEPIYSKMSIKSLVTDVIEAFKYEARKKKITVRHFSTLEGQPDDNVYFVTDPEKFKLIISNLLNNSIMFSYENSVVDIKTELQKDRSLQIDVQDFGEGISEENQKIIFDRFKRADSGINSNIRGHGLGLSVNKALVDLFNGEIKVETKLGEGSTFTVNLPAVDQKGEGILQDDNEFLFSDGEVF